MPDRLVAAVAIALLLALGACGGASTTDAPARYSGIIAASEFVVGDNRFPFGLVSRDGDLLEGASINVRFFSLAQPEPVLLAEAPAVWRSVPGATPHEHSDGELHMHLDYTGVYVVDGVEFSVEGLWQASFDVAAEAGRAFAIEPAAFRVLTEAGAPVVGDLVPRTHNPTIHDVASFSELSTRGEPDQLHNVSVAGAVEAGEPFVVFFASPQFCVTAMCGPVTEVLDQTREQLGGAVEFIHIEPWDLVEAREHGSLVPAAATRDWRLPTEPWTFVVDSEGRVAARFEGFATGGEVLAALGGLG